MPSLNFMPQFADLVARGEKTQTIRQGNRWKVGMDAHLFTGLRTRKCRKLGMGKVVDVRCIVISTNSRLVLVSHKRLQEEELEVFARRDGFDDVESFFVFFDRYKVPVFCGQVIEWDLV